MGGFKLILTFSSAVESADTERRIIAGKIVPYESVGNTSAGPVTVSYTHLTLPTNREV